MKKEAKKHTHGRTPLLSWLERYGQHLRIAICYLVVSGRGGYIDSVSGVFPMFRVYTNYSFKINNKIKFFFTESIILINNNDNKNNNMQ